MKLKINRGYLITGIALFLIEVCIAFVFNTGFIRYTLGDYLVVILVYTFLRGLSNLNIHRAALIALLIAYTVELLQLTPFLEYFNLETNFLAKLVFGTTFHFSDIVAYTLAYITVLFFELKLIHLYNWKLKLKKVCNSFLFKITVVLICVAFFLPNIIVSKWAEGKTYYDVNTIPENKVGIVLGTSKYSKRGTINLYYKYRIDATLKLYKAGKIEFILVSGENSSKYYNEPKLFKEDLIKNGIPEHKIFLDYAGFRTLDSMVRAKLVFGLNSFTIISQRFHNQRAIFLAEQYEIDAIAFNAKNANYSKTKLNKPFREYFARTKAVIDILIGKQPKYLGEKIEIK